MDLSYATNPCIRLNRREQGAWIRQALFHTLENYAITDFVPDAPLPESVNSISDLKLIKTHGWVIDEFGLGNLISFLRSRVFQAADEEYTIDKFKERTGRELSDEDWEKMHYASATTKLFRVRVLLHALLSNGIKGQPSAGRFIRIHLHEAGLSRISTVLRMRKAVFDKGRLSKQVDNPKDICSLFFECMGDKIRAFSTEFQTECYKHMILSGYGDKEAGAFASGLSIPPESDWGIPPRSYSCCGFTFRIVRKDDPRNIEIGQINNCCMQIGMIAESCLIDGIVNPMSSFLVIESDSAPIASSWLRLGRSGILYLDNIEIAEAHQWSLILAHAVTNWGGGLIEGGVWPGMRIGIQYSYVPIKLPRMSMTDELYKSEFGDTDIYTDLTETGCWFFPKV